MKNKSEQQIKLFVIMSILVGLLIGGAASFAEADLTPQEMNGQVEVMISADSGWLPLSRDIVLTIGVSIRTGPQATVAIKGEDGSVLYINENTELLIVESTFSEANQIRRYRFKLVQGMVTAEVKDFDEFQEENNVFEITSKTVSVKAKGTSVTLQDDENGCSSVNRGGEVETTQISEGSCDVITGFQGEDGILEGASTTLTEVGQQATTTSNPDSKTVEIETNASTPLNSSIGNNPFAVMKNQDPENPLEFSALGGAPMTLDDDNDTATVAISPANVTVGQSTGPMNVEINFPDNATLMIQNPRRCKCGKLGGQLATAAGVPVAEPEPEPEPEPIPESEPIAPDPRKPGDKGSPVTP
jgi:hypothetical protein